MKKIAIILAGGTGKRMGLSVPKQFVKIGKKSVLAYSLHAFDQSMADSIVVVSPDEWKWKVNEIIRNEGVSKPYLVTNGGKERFESVFNGLKAAGENFCPDEDSIVMIHDGARPLITVDDINKVITGTLDKKACVLGVRATDTSHIVDENGRIVSTPDRRMMWNAQTPQSFTFDLAFSGYSRLMDSEDRQVTDDAMVVSKFTGAAVYMVEAENENMKLTTGEDLKTIESILLERNVVK